MAGASTLTIGLDRQVAEWAPEIKYVLSELCRIAGFSWHFRWANEDGPALDVYYGPRIREVQAHVRIPYDAVGFDRLPEREPVGVSHFAGLSLLNFSTPDETGQVAPDIVMPNDMVKGAYWLLTGLREPRYARDKRDNLSLTGTAFLRYELFRRPIVSEYGAFLRRVFTDRGHAAAAPSWRDGETQGALVLSHDVDYPEMIRWIEVLRLASGRKSERWRIARQVLRGESHFWQFAEWIEFARQLQTKNAFYFMAARGSLLKYATGLPDAFYDIRSPRFGQLFSELRGQGIEIGLHASYRAYESVAALASEKELLESSSGGPIAGGRHHYWHLDPTAPNDTLLAHERAGLEYDSSLGFEFYPGFRRGTCHPFRPFHAGERREIDVVQLPPTWMDDHFHRRRTVNGITDPMERGIELLDHVRNTGGVAVLDYHVRGMNEQFFPEYGPWLRGWLPDQVGSLRGRTATELQRDYRHYVKALEAGSTDQTDVATSDAVATPPIDIRPMRAEDVDEVAQFHYEFFGTGDVHGSSLAKLGPGALAGLFYRPALDNPFLFVDVVREGAELVAFSVYSSNRAGVFRQSARSHFFPMAATAIRAVLRRPQALPSLLANAVYVKGEELPGELGDPRLGWFFLLGVVPRFRGRIVNPDKGTRVTGELMGRMEITLRERGCSGWFGAVRDDNRPMHKFMIRSGAVDAGTGRGQGQQQRYFLRKFDESAPEARVGGTTG